MGRAEPGIGLPGCLPFVLPVRAEHSRAGRFQGGYQVAGALVAALVDQWVTVNGH